MSISYFLNKKEAFMRISNLFRLTNNLNYPKEFVENKIITYKDHNAQQPYNLIFPYEFNPIILRIIAHIPGDGNIRKDGYARWTQKDTIYMEKLLEKIGLPVKSYKGTSMCIPRILIKVCSKALGTKPKKY